MIGRLIADAGGAYRISMTLIDKFGKRNVQWAIAVASFIVGIALFWDVAFILLVPIIYMISKELKISITHFGLTMAGALVVAHSFLPPHPGITAVTSGVWSRYRHGISVWNLYCDSNDCGCRSLVP